MPALGHIQTHSLPYEAQRLTDELCRDHLAPAVVQLLTHLPAFVVVGAGR